MKLLLVTPPMTQLNTPYPATAYLAGFLREHQARLGLEVAQADAALELFLRLFSAAGLRRVLAELRARVVLGPAADGGDGAELEEGAGEGDEGEVDEADAGRVSEGAAVTIRLDAHPDAEFRGSVRSVQRTVQRSSPQLPLKVARLSVALEKVDTERMKPGMRVRGRVETGRVARALVVPSDAVVPTESGPFVWVPRGRGARPVPVSVGRRNEEWVEVLSGLAEGDTVLRPSPSSPERFPS